MSTLSFGLVRRASLSVVTALLVVPMTTAPAAAQDIRGRILGAAGGALAASFPIGFPKEREIGRGIAATLAGRYPVSADSALNAYVDLVGQVVAQQSPRWAEVPFRFAVLETDEVNAFAAPAGFIFVTRGALSLMESEAELAGVLGHEVAHVDEKHVLERVRKGDMLQRARSEADLTGPLLDEAFGAGAGALFTGLGRGEEMESDSMGMLYAAAAGYRADGLLTFVQRLGAAEQSPSGPRILRALGQTHPKAADRMEALRRQAAARGIDLSAGQSLAERFRRHVPASAPAANRPTGS